MKVSELIWRLSKLEQDCEVRTSGPVHDLGITEIVPHDRHPVVWIFFDSVVPDVPQDDLYSLDYSRNL